MSDTSEEQKDRLSEVNQSDSLCRDFLRGMCDRRFCRYKHEPPEPRLLNFCHDYQNSSCPRPACKFIHCTPQEVEEYKRTGEMSNQIIVEATRKNQMPGLSPICTSYRNGTCRRAHCKYRHLNKDEEDVEIMMLVKNNSKSKNHAPLVVECPQNQNLYETTVLGGGRRLQQQFEFDEYGPTVPKRRLLSNNGLESDFIFTTDLTAPQRQQFNGYCAGNPPQVLRRFDAHDARTLMIEEENNLLHKEVVQLKKQVSDLIATNEFLLDQNANLRVSGKRNGNVVPPVSLTNTLSTNSQGQVIRTVAASVATVPVSLATVTTCNPVGCPVSSIAPTGQILAPSQQILVTTNQPTQIALANSSQAQLAIAQQNLANNLAAQQQQPQLTSQAQQLALATTTQQLTSQAQQLANQQLALASAPQQTQQLTLGNNQQLLAASSQQAQQLNQQLSTQQQISQQLTSQAQQLALANTQQLTSQAQQLALSTNQQLTSQAQQLAMANTPQLSVANVSQCQLALAAASTNQQILAQQTPQIELHRGTQMNAINTSQAIAISNATAPMVSYPIMTHAMPH